MFSALLVQEAQEKALKLNMIELVIDQDSPLDESMLQHPYKITHGTNAGSGIVDTFWYLHGI